jgi:hypothetical protein
VREAWKGALKKKDHAISQKLNAAIALIGIECALISMTARSTTRSNQRPDTDTPIHDSVRVPVGYIGKAEAKMQEFWERNARRLNHCSIKRKSASLPHMGEGSSVRPVLLLSVPLLDREPVMVWRGFFWSAKFPAPIRHRRRRRHLDHHQLRRHTVATLSAQACNYFSTIVSSAPQSIKSAQPV